MNIEHSEIMTGTNPAADARLAAALGTRISAAEEDEVTPVAIGNAGYETNLKGEPVSLEREVERLRADGLRVAFERGLLRAARELAYTNNDFKAGTPEFRAILDARFRIMDVFNRAAKEWAEMNGGAA